MDVYAIYFSISAIFSEKIKMPNHALQTMTAAVTCRAAVMPDLKR